MDVPEIVVAISKEGNPLQSVISAEIGVGGCVCPFESSLEALLTYTRGRSGCDPIRAM